MSKKKKEKPHHDDELEMVPGFPEMNSPVEPKELDEPLTSEMIETDKEPKAYSKAESDFAEHPKFAKFKGEKK